MKMKLSLILLAFFPFVTLISAQSPTVDTKELILEKGVAPHARIDDVYRRFSEGYRKLDAEAVTNLYSEDALYLAPGSDIKRGREKIAEIFSGFFDSVETSGGSLTISFRIVERNVSKDLGYDVGVYTLAQKRGGGTRSSQGNFVVVARRMKNGDWKFALDTYHDLPGAPNGSAQNSIDARELENSFDPIFAEQMEKPHIPGAGVSVFKDGKTNFPKGCGVADIEKKTPVIDDRTIFRTGSIAKVFTATAVMQPADNGKINLTNDVDKYMTSGKIPNAFAQPITFGHLPLRTV